MLNSRQKTKQLGICKCTSLKIHLTCIYLLCHFSRVGKHDQGCTTGVKLSLDVFQDSLEVLVLRAMYNDSVCVFLLHSRIEFLLCEGRWQIGMLLEAVVQQKLLLFRRQPCSFQRCHSIRMLPKACSIHMLPKIMRLDLIYSQRNVPVIPRQYW